MRISTIPISYLSEIGYLNLHWVVWKNSGSQAIPIIARAIISTSSFYKTFPFGNDYPKFNLSYRWQAVYFYTYSTCLELEVRPE